MNRTPATRREPLGILLATDEGLVECVPGARTTRGIEGRRFTSVDARDDVAVAGAPGADGGVWLHAGGHWQQVWTGDARSLHVGKLTRGEGMIYLGTGDGHLLRSTDRGATWIETPGVTTLRHDGAVLPLRAVLPTVAGVAEVTGGTVMAFNGGGMWFRDDATDTWFHRSEGLDQHVHRFYRHPDLDHRFYATTDTGIYRTSDQGNNWVQSITDLDRGWGGSLAVFPGPRDTLLLSLARSAPGVEGALYRSTDGGVHWSRVLLADEDEWERTPAVVHPHEWEDVIFVAAGPRLFASHDRGATWMQMADGLPPANAIAASV